VKGVRGRGCGVGGGRPDDRRVDQAGRLRRIPKLFNLRTDPFERADITSNTYYDWFLDHDFIAACGTSIATPFLDTFREFPPRHEPARFTIHHAVAKLKTFLARD
jgi:hypothetical protein